MELNETLSPVAELERDLENSLRPKDSSDSSRSVLVRVCFEVSGRWCEYYLSSEEASELEGCYRYTQLGEAGDDKSRLDDGTHSHTNRDKHLSYKLAVSLSGDWENKGEVGDADICFTADAITTLRLGPTFSASEFNELSEVICDLARRALALNCDFRSLAGTEMTNDRFDVRVKSYSILDEAH